MWFYLFLKKNIGSSPHPARVQSLYPDLKDACNNYKDFRSPIIYYVRVTYTQKYFILFYVKALQDKHCCGMHTVVGKTLCKYGTC